MTNNLNAEQTDPHREEVENILVLQKSDPVHAFEALEALAPQSVNAMFELGWAHSHGLGTVVDEAAAEKFYRRAGELGSPTALYNVGTFYERRNEYAQALEFYNKAATLGDVTAQEKWHRLDQLVRSIEAYDLRSTDPVRAHEAFHQLAEEGYVLSMVNLAWTYEHGCGTSADLELAEHWYRRAFNEGEDLSKMHAAYFLGHISYRRGDYSKALEYLQYACNQEDGRAGYLLGKMYARGQGVAKDIRKARSLYERAAQLGDPVAPLALAKQDLSGRFGVRNFLHGIQRFLQAQRVYAASLKKVNGKWVHSAIEVKSTNSHGTPNR